MNPIIVYIGCACAAINLALTIWRIVHETKPAVEAPRLTANFPQAR